MHGCDSKALLIKDLPFISLADKKIRSFYSGYCHLGLHNKSILLYKVWQKDIMVNKSDLLR